jgi:hypothetical protein
VKSRGFLRAIVGLVALSLLSVVPEPVGRLTPRALAQDEAPDKKKAGELRERVRKTVPVIEHVLEKIRPADLEVKALADSLSGPEQALQFVRDKIGLDLYPGRLRGAESTLRCRSGNSLDRALLLAELLTHKGLEVRMVRSRLSDAQATEILNNWGRRASLPAVTGEAGVDSVPDSWFLAAGATPETGRKALSERMDQGLREA